MARDRWGIAAGIVLVALFLGAAVLNAMPSAMGWSASQREVAVTAVALIAWPVYGAWMGWRRGAPARPWRFPVVFWSTVVFVAVGGLFALTVDGLLAFPGVLALVFSTAPFYGLQYRSLLRTDWADRHPRAGVRGQRGDRGERRRPRRQRAGAGALTASSHAEAPERSLIRCVSCRGGSSIL